MTRSATSSRSARAERLLGGVGSTADEDRPPDVGHRALEPEAEVDGQVIAHLDVVLTGELHPRASSRSSSRAARVPRPQLPRGITRHTWSMWSEWEPDHRGQLHGAPA